MKEIDTTEGYMDPKRITIFMPYQEMKWIEKEIARITHETEIVKCLIPGANYGRIALYYVDYIPELEKKQLTNSQMNEKTYD